MSSNVPHVPKSNLSNCVQVSFAFYTEITQIYEFSIIWENNTNLKHLYSKYQVYIFITYFHVVVMI